MALSSSRLSCTHVSYDEIAECDNFIVEISDMDQGKASKVYYLTNTDPRP